MLRVAIVVVDSRATTVYDRGQCGTRGAYVQARGHAQATTERERERGFGPENSLRAGDRPCRRVEYARPCYNRRRLCGKVKRVRFYRRRYVRVKYVHCVLDRLDSIRQHSFLGRATRNHARLLRLLPRGNRNGGPTGAHCTVMPLRSRVWSPVVIIYD